MKPSRTRRIKKKNLRNGGYTLNAWKYNMPPDHENVGRAMTCEEFRKQI